MHATTVEHSVDLAALVPAWRALWRRCERATPFQSPEWLVPWWDVFEPGALRVIAVHQDDQLVGLAPLYRETGEHGPRLLPIGVALSDYLDILLAPEFEADAARAIGEAIDAMDDIAACEFGELSDDAMAFALSPPRGWDARVVPSSTTPFLPLSSSSPNALAQSVRPSRLRHLRTARRRIERRGDGAILEGDVDNATALFSELVRLHNLQCQAEPGVFADPRVSAFHIAALPGLMEQGIARLYALMIGDAPVGVYYGLFHNDCAYAYSGGYDPGHAFESPGAVLIGHAIERAIEEGAREFHFLRGREAYKYEWGAIDRWNSRLVLSRTQQSRVYA